MDCTDIVIGVARGQRFRVFDYYTRDRSTPRRDDFYGGSDSITAAVGMEVDGFTTIKWRKRLQAGGEYLSNLPNFTPRLHCRTAGINVGMRKLVYDIASFPFWSMGMRLGMTLAANCMYVATIQA